MTLGSPSATIVSLYSAVPSQAAHFIAFSFSSLETYSYGNARAKTFATKVSGSLPLVLF